MLVLVLVGYLLMDDSRYPRDRANPTGRGQAQGPHIRPTTPLVPTNSIMRGDKYGSPTRLYTRILDVCERIRVVGRVPELAPEVMIGPHIILGIHVIIFFQH